MSDNGKRVDCVQVIHTLSTGVARGQDGVQIKIIPELVLMKKDMLRYVQDVRAVRRMVRTLSDHHVVL